MSAPAPVAKLPAAVPLMVTVSAPAPVVTASMVLKLAVLPPLAKVPEPPLNVTVDAAVSVAPDSVSLPAPPVMVSLPNTPVRLTRSLPSPASIRSFPRPPSMVSLPAPARIRSSLKLVPALVSPSLPSIRSEPPAAGST